VSENALILDVQWDPFGQDVLHVDFARVNLSEEVETTVRVELRGEAPGTRVGGVVEQQIREIDIVCPVSSIPEHLELNINSLELGQVLHVSDLNLPEGAKLVTDPATPAVQCMEPAVEVEEDEARATDGAEPEIIGRKAEPEEEG
jgi:large subunit ribosomal protein L25